MITPAMAQRAILKRLVISFHDLTEARQFLNKLLGLNAEAPPAAGDTLVRKALETALVVSYARPFSGNRGAPDVTRDMPDELLSDLTPEQRRVHDHIVELRNKEFAHSDAERSDVNVFVGRWADGRPLASPVSNVTRAPLRIDELRTLDTLFEHWHVQIYDEMRRIESGLTPGESF